MQPAVRPRPRGQAHSRKPAREDAGAPPGANARLIALPACLRGRGRTARRHWLRLILKDNYCVSTRALFVIGEVASKAIKQIAPHRRFQLQFAYATVLAA